MSIRSIYGRTAAIACGHPAAAAAGWEALARGGSVADAAIAAASVLAVVLPQACTIGGDAFILIHDAKEGRTYGLNASGRSPHRTDTARLTPTALERGPLSCATPGVVAGWEALHQKFGRLPWHANFQRAILLAEDGFPASPGLAGATTSLRSLLERDPGCAEIFLANGALKPGAPFRQPALAATLRQLAQTGAAGFYKGHAAASIAHYVQSRGGWLAEDDFTHCTSEWVEPIECAYRDLRVQVMPPNSYGLFMLLQLSVLDSIDLKGAAPDSVERYRALIAAAQAAFARGDRFVADPDVLDRGPSPALSGESLEALRRDFRDRAGAAPANRGGTAVVSAVDEHGNAVAVVQSVFLAFGSAVADPQSGVLMNNRMLGFTLTPDHPNTAAPAKRPAHTLNPVITLQGGRVRHVLLTPGGPGQTLTLSQVLQASVDHGLPIHDAVALPRWSMDLQGRVIVEPSFPESVRAALESGGIPAGLGERGSPFFGSVECVERLADGGLAAVADDRREAHAIAL
jgi:gamma-glutamyltranspeptidase/glutathione hydrolase